MAADWDERARRNAPFFICTEAANSAEEFEESGRRDLEKILAGIQLPANAIVVEIGCGVGRVALALAPRVARIYAVDLSAEMIARAREFCARQENILFFQTPGDLSPLPSACADLVYSHIVFQHIPIRRDIRRYVGEAFRVLKPGGIFRADVDGRSHQWFRRWIADSWSGVVFSPAGWRRELARAGFEILEITGAGTQYLWATARRPPGAQSSS